MEFLTVSQLELNKAGYLISKETKKPVNHVEFVKQQKVAEFTIKFAETIKDKTFKCGKIDNIEEIKTSVLATINSKNLKEYVTTPIKPTSKVNDEMVKYALDFVAFEESKSDIEKLNLLMAEFDVIDAIETVGDYFTEGLTKLNAIYSIEEVLTAMKVTTEKLK